MNPSIEAARAQAVRRGSRKSASSFGRPKIELGIPKVLSGNTKFGILGEVHHSTL
jgi:hypothetical protein